MTIRNRNGPIATPARKLEAVSEASRQLLSAEDDAVLAATTVDIVQQIFDQSLVAMWSYDADAETLVPIGATDEAREFDATAASEIRAIPSGTAEMEIFHGGESVRVEDYADLENAAHPENPLRTLLLFPLGSHGLLNVGFPTVTEIDPSERDLLEILARNVHAAFDRLHREREVRQRSTAMEAAIDGMAILDEAGEYVYVNQAHADIYGYDTPEDLVGTSWRRLYDAEETEHFAHEVLPTVREAGHWRGEAVGTRADGTTFPQEVSLASLKDGGLVCVVRDITERKAYEERLEALNAATQDLTQAETAAEVARTGLQAVQQILGFDVGCVRLFDAEANALDPVALTDAAEALVASRPAFDLEATLAGRAYRQKMVVRNAGDEAASVDEIPTEASLHLPLGDHGVLTIVTQPDERFADLEISLMEALAASVRAALDRAGREETLRENERELREQHEQLDTLHRITTLVQEIGDDLIEATTRAELERTVCQRVVASELYQSVWIGEVGVTRDRVDVTVGAGLDDEHLDVLDEMPLALLGEGTVEEALETGEIEVIRQYETKPTSEPGAVEQEGRVEATAAIPLAYGDRIHGVLVVNGMREDVFSENALAGFESLGKLVGFTLSALRNRELLLSDAIVELELAVADPTIFYSAVTAELDCRCRFDRSVPLEDGKVLTYHLIGGNEQERVLGMAQTADHIEDAKVVSERDDGFVLQTVTDRSLSHFALQAGASLQSAVVVDGEARVTLEAPHSADVRAIIDAFHGAFEDVDLVAKRERDRAVQTETEYRESVAADLTEKQRAALEAAYAAGYYDWPREITAEELAESMGVSSSTLHQHLRHGVRSLAAAFFDEPQRANAVQ